MDSSSCIKNRGNLCLLLPGFTSLYSSILRRRVIAADYKLTLASRYNRNFSDVRYSNKISLFFALTSVVYILLLTLLLLKLSMVFKRLLLICLATFIIQRLRLIIFDIAFFFVHRCITWSVYTFISKFIIMYVTIIAVGIQISVPICC